MTDIHIDTLANWESPADAPRYHPRLPIFGVTCGHCDEHPNWDRKIKMWRCSSCGGQAATPKAKRARMLPGQQQLFSC